MLTIILNFNQILNSDYFNILSGSDKGVITPLSELQKIPLTKNEYKPYCTYIYLFMLIYTLHIFIYLLVDLYSDDYLLAYITHEPIVYIILIGWFCYILKFTSLSYYFLCSCIDNPYELLLCLFHGCSSFPSIIFLSPKNRFQIHHSLPCAHLT